MDHPSARPARSSPPTAARCAARLAVSFALACAGLATRARALEFELPPPPPVVSSEGGATGEVDEFDDGDAIVIVAPERTSVYDAPTYHEHETYLRNAPLQKQLTVDEAMDVPGILGDPVKAITYLPGVVSGGFGILVHGSKDGESSATLNHMPVGYLFHMGSMHSVMSPEAIEQFDVYLGGGDVTYGDVTGGVLDVTPRYPIGAGSGYAHLGALDSSFGFDASLGENLAWSVHARRSYFDLIIDIDSFNDTDEAQAARLTIGEFPNYYDVNTMLCYRDGDHQLSLEVLVARDGFGIETREEAVTDPSASGEVAGAYGFTTAGVRWRYDAGAYRGNSLLSYTRYSERMRIFDDFATDVESDLCTLYHVSTFESGPHDVAAGVEVSFLQLPVEATLPLLSDVDEVDPDLTSAPVFVLDELFDMTVVSLFAQDTVEVAEGLRVRFGLRLEDGCLPTYDPYAMPRGAIVFDATESDVFSAAAGRYASRPAVYKYLEDIGNPSITDERSSQYSLSWKHRFGETGSLTVEPYYKTLDHLALSDPVSRFLNTGEGSAYGVSIGAKLRGEAWYFDASYAWQEAERQLTSDDPERYSFFGDVTHSLQLGFSFRAGPRWSAGFLAKAATGQPYTPVEGTYLYTDTDGSNRIRPIWGTPYSERLPAFFTLNARTAYAVRRDDGSSLELSAEIINLTNHVNVNGIRYNSTYDQVGYTIGLPFVPSLNLTYRW